MHIGELIEKYGYLALFVGTLLEGETVLVMSGYAAHRGYLHLPLVMLIAFVGSSVHDQSFFWVGRLWGRRLLGAHPSWQARVDRARPHIDRYGNAFIVGFRFLFGLRMVSPFALAVGGVPPLRFTALTMIGAALWSVGIAGGGYLFGHGLTLVLARAHRYEAEALGFLALAGLLVWLTRVLRDRRHAA